MFDYQQIIDKYYPAETPLRDIYIRHCRSVANKALDIARRKHLDVDLGDVEAAAMLHDIGIVLTDAAGIQCHGTEPYLTHGRLGADILRREGAPEIYARVAERHTGSGLDADNLAAIGPCLPADRCYMPETTLERLVCYADKFFSKSGDMKEKPLDRVRASMAKFGDASLHRFEALHEAFS
jgi:uncharacterized protein